MTVKARFAPRPPATCTSAAYATLFSWAFARHHKASSPIAYRRHRLGAALLPNPSTSSLDGMKWVGLNYDNADNVVYQARRFDRYKEVIAELLEKGAAYYCYCSKGELEAMRESRKRRHGNLRPPLASEEAKLCRNPADVQPVVRFKTPLDSVTKWTDLVKVKSPFPNEALDDLIIARRRTPTYSFCVVVVDDYDMGVTHVIPRRRPCEQYPEQINILKAGGATLPNTATCPMILNEQGQKNLQTQRRYRRHHRFRRDGHPARSHTQLSGARLGWAHGDDKFFTMEQFIEWFDLKDVSPSPNRMDLKKLYWINGEHVKITPNDKLAEMGKTAPCPTRYP